MKDMSPKTINKTDSKGSTHGYWEISIPLTRHLGDDEFMDNGQYESKGYYIHGKKIGYWFALQTSQENNYSFTTKEFYII